ncbi:LysE family transporter [Anaerovorax odorimutans]|uniref:LysE family transporter n=1 Tax=Anaerovorax odorimutans TaxID=109327 RepID=UPI00040CEC1D|nr:LysE family transporter [Anaerovorax odorimutans]
MSTHAIIAFLIYVLINAFTPGPGNILALNTVTNYGWSKGINLFLGIFTGYYVVQIICAVFVFGLNELMNPVMFAMKYLGAAYIIYLSFHIAISKPIKSEEQKSASFFKGFILQLVNVKIYFFGVTALSGYVVPYKSSLEMLILFELIIATVGTIATLTWILLGKLFRQAYEKHFHVINIILAVMLIQCAFSMLFE